MKFFKIFLTSSRPPFSKRSSVILSITITMTNKCKAMIIDEQNGIHTTLKE